MLVVSAKSHAIYTIVMDTLMLPYRLWDIDPIIENTIEP